MITRRITLRIIIIVIKTRSTILKSTITKLTLTIDLINIIMENPTSMMHKTIRSPITLWTNRPQTTLDRATLSTKPRRIMCPMRSPRAFTVQISIKTHCLTISKLFQLNQTVQTFSQMSTTQTVTLCIWMSHLWLMRDTSNIEGMDTILTMLHSGTNKSRHIETINNRWTG